MVSLVAAFVAMRRAGHHLLAAPLLGLPSLSDGLS